MRFLLAYGRATSKLGRQSFANTFPTAVPLIDNSDRLFDITPAGPLLYRCRSCSRLRDL